MKQEQGKEPRRDNIKWEEQA